MWLNQMIPKKSLGLESSECVDRVPQEMTTYQKRGDRPTNSTNTSCSGGAPQGKGRWGVARKKGPRVIREGGLPEGDDPLQGKLKSK